MRIVNFGQVMNVEDGFKMSYQFTIELPTGERADVLTNEETVQQLVDVMTGRGTLSQPALEPQGSATRPDADEYDYTFGGDVGELSIEKAPVAFDTEPPYFEEAVPEPKSSLGQVKKVPGQTKARTVPKDEMGYPMVQQAVKDSGYPLDDGEDDGAQI